jgi:hypothetical protein
MHDVDVVGVAGEAARVPVALPAPPPLPSSVRYRARVAALPSEVERSSRELLDATLSLGDVPLSLSRPPRAPPAARRAPAPARTGTGTTAAAAAAAATETAAAETAAAAAAPAVAAAAASAVTRGAAQPTSVAGADVHVDGAGSVQSPPPLASVFATLFGAVLRVLVTAMALATQLALVLVTACVQLAVLVVRVMRWSTQPKRDSDAERLRLRMTAAASYREWHACALELDELLGTRGRSQLRDGEDRVEGVRDACSACDALMRETPCVMMVATMVSMMFMRV